MADLTQTAANVLLSVDAVQTRVVAGATITAGMPVWKDPLANNKAKPCKADSAGTANCDGIALNGASDGQPLYISDIKDANINLGATLTVGQVYAVSAANAGKICPYSDLGTTNRVTVLGVATTADLLKLGVINSGVAKP